MNSRNRKSPCCVVEAQSVHARSLPRSLARLSVPKVVLIFLSHFLQSARLASRPAGSRGTFASAWCESPLRQRWAGEKLYLRFPPLWCCTVFSLPFRFAHCCCLFVFLLPSASSLGLCVSFQIQFQFQFILVRRDSTY